MPSNRSQALTFANAIHAFPQTKAFRVLRPRGEDPATWRLQPLDAEVISDDGSGGGFYIVAAHNVLPNGSVNGCYMDVSLPERISDDVYFLDGNTIRRERNHKSSVPAIAIDCFGEYELFYVRSAPQIGINVLEQGLAKSRRKRYIAQDLGYIFRNEKRYREAAEMFEVVADEGVPSCYIYAELAQLYEKLGEPEKQKKYDTLFKKSTC